MKASIQGDLLRLKGDFGNKVTYIDGTPVRTQQGPDGVAQFPTLLLEIQSSFANEGVDISGGFNSEFEVEVVATVEDRGGWVGSGKVNNGPEFEVQATLENRDGGVDGGGRLSGKFNLELETTSKSHSGWFSSGNLSGELVLTKAQIRSLKDGSHYIKVYIVDNFTSEDTSDGAG